MSKEYIKKLRQFNTATLSDALDSLNINGGLEGLIPRSKNSDICGKAFTVEYGIPNEAEKTIAKAADFIDEVKSDEVIILANNGRKDCTIWGGILTLMAQKKDIEGTVIDGACRDLDEIEKNGYSLFSKSVFMKTGKGRAIKRNNQVPVKIGEIQIFPGDYVRGDKNGVLIIPQEIVAEVLMRAESISKTESKIVDAISKDMSLTEARKKFKYHRPWEE